jgi:histidine ammonia-lyase
MPTKIQINSDVELDGRTLTDGRLAQIARGSSAFRVSPASMTRVKQANTAALEISRRRPVYGQTTAVGSKRTVKVTSDQQHSHILNLLRSHAATAGPRVDPTITRAMMAVRLNQLLAGGSGVSPDVVKKLHEALVCGLTPPIRRYNALGTGDLGSLAVMALCLIGERPWEGGSIKPVEFISTDPMAFISSSALTQGEAALANSDLLRINETGLMIAALSFIAMGGSPEAYSPEVMAAKPHDSQRDIAAKLRNLLGRQPLYQSGRVQDPYSLRAIPQVDGAALDSFRRLSKVLSVEINSSSENPLVTAQDVFHNGNFHTAFLALALDNLRVAIYQTAALSAARTSDLMDPLVSNFHQHLSSGSDSSYGLHIIEYIANSALADIRRLAGPATLGAVVFDKRAEEHAGFAPQAAWSTTELIPAYETILACELITATRAIQQKAIAITGTSQGLAELFEQASLALGSDFSDKSLDPLLDSATSLIQSR